MIRTGDQYRDGLADDREVWIRGARVDDVTSHPALAYSVNSIASLYDLQHASPHQDVLTYRDDEGELVPLSYLLPHSGDDLQRRGRAFKVAADATCGLMGRSPDFMNVALAAFAAAADFFGQNDPAYAENVRRYFDYCRANDLYLVHAAINPQTDRSKSSAEQADPFIHLGVVRETDEGIVVRGAKMIGTLVPIADELLVFPLPRYAPGDERYTTAFAIPVGTPGLRLVCREPFGQDLRSLADHPLARFDEIDATCIFDDVLVPWERVFLYGDVDRANALWDATLTRHHTGHQGIVRGVAKAELLVGIAIALARSAKTDAFLHVQEMLGELIGYLELARSAVLLAEQRATPSVWGTISPDIAPIQAIRYHFPRWCARMLEVIQILGGGSLLSIPAEADMDEAAEHGVARFFGSGDDSSGQERMRLLKLAWDASGDSFGQRQQQYERYHSGDPVRLAALQYLAYDTSALDDVVARALAVEAQELLPTGSPG